MVDIDGNKGLDSWAPFRRGHPSSHFLTSFLPSCHFASPPAFPPRADNVTVSKTSAARNYAVSGSVILTRGCSASASGAIRCLDNFPSTGAQKWTYFQLTATNSVNATIITSRVVRNQCLTLARSLKCVNPSCSELSKNNVPQPIFSFEPRIRYWTASTISIGPGVASSPLLTVTGNGVRRMVPFSPDGIIDYVIPASADQDIVPNSSPTKQCAVVWQYRKLGGQVWERCYEVFDHYF